jgi:hypothetical protein
MPTLYEDLRSEPTREGRRAITGDVFTRMRAGQSDACFAFADLCDQVISDFQFSGLEPRYVQGEFSAGRSAHFVRDEARVSGFLSAIHRVPRNYRQRDRVVVDACTGSSAILAIQAALSDERADVRAIEINERAARCAEAVVMLAGVDDQVSITHGDALTLPLPDRPVLAIAEAFSAAMLHEPGGQVIQRLARVAHAQEVLPKKVLVHAHDGSTAWQYAGTVDLTDESNTLSGRLLSTGDGNRNIRVYTGLLDARSEPVLAQLDATYITRSESIGTVAVSRAGTGILFAYQMGASTDQIGTQFTTT